MATKPIEPPGPKPPLPGLLKAQMLIQGVIGSQTINAANVLHTLCATPGPYTPAQLTTYATSFYNAFNTRFAQYMSTSYHYNGCVVTALDGTGVQGLYSHTAAGTDAGTVLSPGQTVAITWKANIAWRGGRPRTYLAGITNAFTVNPGGSGLNSSRTSALATSAIGFIGDINALTIASGATTLGFPSYYSKYQFRPTPIFYFFTTAVVHDRLDSQRRRNGKESAFGIN